MTDASKAFLQELADIAKQAAIIITVRDEFYSQLAWCREWLDFDPHLHRVGFIGRQGLADAIRKPAGKENVYLDHVLVERIVNDAGDDPGILPFVQETMRRLWERMNELYIDIKDYEKLQGYGVSGLKYAIAAKADSAYKSLPSNEQRDIARRIFIRLVQFGEGKPDTRRQLPVSKLRVDGDSSELFEKTLEHLSSENHRLLTLSGGKGDERKVDIVHESLILAWPQFQEWLKDFREYDKQRRILEFKVEEWSRLGGKETGLLDEGELAEAKTLLDSSYAGLLGIDGRLHTFIKKSELAVDPGWNQTGLINLLIIIVSSALMLGLAYLMLSSIKSSTVKNTIYLTIVLTIMLVIGFFWLLGKKEQYIHKSKRYSHIFAGKYHILFAFFTLFMCVFLWGRFGLDEQDRQLYCLENGFPENNKKFIDIAILDNSEARVVNNVLEQTLLIHQGVKASIIQKDFLLKCEDKFDYTSEVIIIKKSEKISYGLDAREVQKNKKISIPPLVSSLVSEFDACEKTAAL